ncbi:cyclin-D5-1-like [Pyrus x bretschneideri]|uniref:cyclin-D5-1-like n=1 Tax=Pyrus x bretschneideri TaxID=225117 RepID=UPI00202FDFD0|nr:cyclin-D5-1-like [Pyrus x bretschneideri]
MAFALEEEQLQKLIHREIEFGFEKDEDLVIPAWVLDARLESITWVLQRRTGLGFHPRTAYLCMTYFDRFISLRLIPVAMVRLLSVACLSLAAKMKEQNIPSLSQYEVENPHFFERKLIQKMELMVLGALEWKMSMITPFSFIDYFVSKLCQESPSDVKLKIVDLLLSIITEINLMHQRPSAVAAAATLMALDQKLTIEALELKINTIPELKLLEIEAVFSCYNILQELKTEKPKEPSL